jgi:hypothetical protein
MEKLPTKTTMPEVVINSLNPVKGAQARDLRRQAFCHIKPHQGE